MIMKLSDIKNGNLSAEWAEKGYELPTRRTDCRF